MKQLVLNMNGNNEAKRGTSAEGDGRAGTNKLSSLLKCHLGWIVEPKQPVSVCARVLSDPAEAQSGGSFYTQIKKVDLLVQ